MLPQQTLDQFDAYLAEAHETFEGVVIGGAALALLGVVSRPTRDCDVLDPVISEPVSLLAVSFARLQRSQGIDLADDWLNNGPASLVDVLPAGWRDRVRQLYRGKAIVLTTLCRADLLRSKLFALCDRGIDLQDCVALSPTADELSELEPWVAKQDAHPDWPDHVHATLLDLARRLEHGLS